MRARSAFFCSGCASCQMSAPLRGAYSERIFSGDVILQLLDRLMLSRYDPVHEITDGNDSDHLLVLYDRKMTNSVLGDDSHALVDNMLRLYGNYGTCHDFLDPSLFRGPPAQYNFARVITLRNDSHQLLIQDH